MQTKDIPKIRKELNDRKAILRCAEEFSMVGDPTRLKICYLLCRHKEFSVGDIAKIVGVSIFAVSHTLSKLQRADMVESRREIRTVYYKLKKTPLIQLVKERLHYYEEI